MWSTLQAKQRWRNWITCVVSSSKKSILCSKCVRMQLKKRGLSAFTGTAPVRLPPWSWPEEERCSQITARLLSTLRTPLQLRCHCCPLHAWPSSHSLSGTDWCVWFLLAWPQWCVLHCCHFDVKPCFQPKMVLLQKLSAEFRYFCLLVHWDCGILV